MLSMYTFFFFGFGWSFLVVFWVRGGHIEAVMMLLLLILTLSFSHSMARTGPGTGV